jgi:hypothetical protein
MTQEKRPKFEFVIDEEYMDSILESTFETVFTDDQWEEFNDRVGDGIYTAVYDTIRDMLDHAELLARNKDAADTKPHYALKYKHPNAHVFDWKELKQRFKTETDAQAYIDYGRPLGEDEEWKIEKVE